MGIVGKGEVCFLNGYFQLSLRDFVIAIVSRETWWFIGVVGCCGFVVFEGGWCFTWNISPAYFYGWLW